MRMTPHTAHEIGMHLETKEIAGSDRYAIDNDQHLHRIRLVFDGRESINLLVAKHCARSHHRGADLLLHVSGHCTDTG